MRPTPLPARSSGKRNSVLTFNAIAELRRTCWRPVGAWQSYGNVRCRNLERFGLLGCLTNGCEVMDETSRRHWDRSNRVCDGPRLLVLNLEYLVE